MWDGSGVEPAVFGPSIWSLIMDGMFGVEGRLIFRVSTGIIARRARLSVHLTLGLILGLALSLA